MTHRLPRLLAAIALTALTAAACSITGINGNKKISELDADERVQACENTREYYEKKISEDDAKHVGCVTAGVLAASFGGGDVSICTGAYDECMAKPVEQNEQDACEPGDDSTCDATISDYEDCLEEQVEEYKDLIDRYTCATGLDGSVSIEQEAGPACKAFYEQCPGGL